MTYAFSQKVSKTGKLSGVNAPMPPEGSLLLEMALLLEALQAVRQPGGPHPGEILGRR